MYRNIAATIVLSRGLIFLLLIIGSQIAFIEKEYSQSVWRTEIDLSRERLGPELTRMVMVGDAWFYSQIASEGYEPRVDATPRATWAFFPLFPLLTRAIPAPFPIAALLLSNLAFAAALFLVAATGLRLGASAETVERAVFFIAFFPASYFFSLPMTEAVFLCLSATAFYFAASDRWWAAGLAGALAAATRLTGVLLLPALVLLPLQQRRSLSRQQLWLLLIPTGTVAFMAYMDRLTGDPLAFVSVQRLWHRGQWSMSFSTGSAWNFALLNAAAALFLIIAAVAMLRRREWSYAAYTLLAVALPLSTGTVQSVTRYAVVVFPAFLWLAGWAGTRHRERMVTATFILLLGWMLAMLVLRVDFAMA